MAKGRNLRSIWETAFNFPRRWQTGRHLAYHSGIGTESPLLSYSTYTILSFYIINKHTILFLFVKLLLPTRYRIPYTKKLKYKILRYHQPLPPFQEKTTEGKKIKRYNIVCIFYRTQYSTSRSGEATTRNIPLGSEATEPHHTLR